jgi:hypothetical protein
MPSFVKIEQVVENLRLLEPWYILFVRLVGARVNEFNRKICPKKLRTANIQHANRYLVVWGIF